jgi:aspartate aminotransferase-like enzyme
MPVVQEDILLIPGPTMIPPDVRAALAAPPIGHRSRQFAEMIEEITQGLRKVFKTEADVFVFTASGTGAMEASLVNMLSPGDRILVVSNGVFGERFISMAEAFGLQVDKVTFPFGNAADPDSVNSQLKRNPGAKAVIITHNETSTGVTNDVAPIAEIARKHGAISIVDSVSGLAAIDLKTDDWGLDVVVGGSQKAFMLPPGLSFISVSARAWEMHKSARLPRFYWDLTKMKDSLEKGQTPFTPNVCFFSGLRASLRRILEEGLERVFERHAKVADLTRNRVKALGFQLLADEKHASNAVTAVKAPQGFDETDMRRYVQDRFGILLAGGQGDLKGKIFRIAHVGCVSEREIFAAIEAIETYLSSKAQG